MRWLLPSLLAAVAIAQPVKPWRVLLVSGGGTPASNAIAHEKNVNFVARSLVELGLPFRAIETYFSVGTADLPDTAYLAELPQDRWELQILDILFGRGGIDLQYRHHAVTAVTGPGRRSEVLRAVREAAASLREGQTLLLYTTDHGQRSEDGSKNSALVMWGGEKLTAQELRSALDAGSSRGRVVLVMAQCFSGGFASVAYGPGVKLATGDRCGFFATTHARESAGCTPELSEADYDDYTTRFFSALRGRDRVGRPVRSADFDADGVVSLSEAHAYALGSEETLDVPVKTSELFLEDAGVAATASWQKALAYAPADERVAWVMLRQRLGLADAEPDTAIGAGLVATRRQIDVLQSERESVERRLDSLEEELRFSVLERWPIIDTPYHPQFAHLLQKQGASIRKYLVAHPAFGPWREAMNKLQTLDADLAAVQVQEAWWLRADRLAKHLRRRLQVNGSVRTAYERLRHCEATAIGR